MVKVDNDEQELVVVVDCCIALRPGYSFHYPVPDFRAGCSGEEMVPHPRWLAHWDGLLDYA